MRRIISVLVAFVCLVVVGCAKDPVSRSETNNPDVTVSLLFTHNGTSVYRFYDAGEFHYFAVDSRGMRQTFSDWTESCGKNCTRRRSEAVHTMLYNGGEK